MDLGLCGRWAEDLQIVRLGIVGGIGFEIVVPSGLRSWDHLGWGFSSHLVWGCETMKFEIPATMGP